MENQTKEAVADRFKLIRNTFEWSLADAGKAIGVDRQTWHKIESGVRQPGSEVLSKLSKIKVSLDWLFTGKGKMILPGRKETK